MKSILWVIVAAILCVGCGKPDKNAKDSVGETRPTTKLSDRAQKVLDSLRQDSSKFQFSLHHYYSPSAGIVLSTKPTAGTNVHHAQVNHEEAVRITQYFAEQGLLDGSSPLPAGRLDPGWWLNVMDSYWYLGKEGGAPFSHEGLLGVRSVLSPKSAKVWDAFIADAKKKMLPTPKFPVPLTKVAKTIVDAVCKDSSQFLFSIHDHHSPVAGLVLARKAYADAKIYHSKIDHDEAVRIITYAAENGLLDRTDALMRGQAPPGWWVSAGNSHWYLGEDRGALFSRKDILGLRAVLSPESKKAWDAFLANAKKRLFPTLKDGEMVLTEKAKKAVAAVRKDSSTFDLTINHISPWGSVGIRLSTTSPRSKGTHHGQVDHDEAVRIMSYLAENGLLDRDDPMPDDKLWGWWIHAPRSSWCIGRDKFAMFRCKDVLNVRSVLSPKSAKVWDAFLAGAKKMAAKK